MNSKGWKKAKTQLMGASVAFLLTLPAWASENSSHFRHSFDQDAVPASNMRVAQNVGDFRAGQGGDPSKKIELLNKLKRSGNLSDKRLLEDWESRHSTFDFDDTGVPDEKELKEFSLNSEEVKIFEFVTATNYSQHLQKMIYPDIVKWAHGNDFSILEEYMKDIDGRDIFSPYQVFPGRPVDDANIAKSDCADEYCNRKSTVLFNQAIRYAEDAHQEVVLLERSKDGGPWTRYCSAFLISSRYAITALHCFGGSGKTLQRNFTLSESKNFGWSLGVSSKRYDFSFLLNDGSESYMRKKVNKIYIPYHHDRLPAYDAGYPPRLDLALFEFAPEAIDIPVVENLGDDSFVIGDVVTFSGFGSTNVATARWNRYAAFNVLKDYEAGEGVNHLLWESGDRYLNGGPCDGDSGGPMYLGFERGYKDDLNTVVGVVSSLESSKILGTFSCMYVTGRAVSIMEFVPDICTLTDNQPVACR